MVVLLVSSDSGPLVCSCGPSQVSPSALVLTMSDDGDGGQEAAAACCGGLTGNKSPAIAVSESDAASSSSSLSHAACPSSSTWPAELASHRVTSSDGCGVPGHSLSSTFVHDAFSSLIDIFPLASELPLHGRSTSDRLRTSDTSQTPSDVNYVVMHHLIL